MPEARRPFGQWAVHGARQRRGQDLSVHAEGQIAAGDVLELIRQRVIEQEPDAERAEHLRLRQADRDWDGDDLQDAVRLREQADAVLPAEGGAHRRLVGGDDRRPWRAAGAVEQHTGAVGHQHQARVQLRAVATGDVLHRRRVVGFDCRLQLRQIGDEPRHQREGLGAFGTQLVDLGAGRDDLAFERALGFGRHGPVDEVNRDADAEHRQQRAGEEDPAPQRRQEFHRTAKSSSATPPSGTAVGRASDDTPSFQAITPYVPGGTLSM